VPTCTQRRPAASSISRSTQLTSSFVRCTAIVAALASACLLLLVGSAHASKAGKTYAYTNEYAKGFGYTDRFRGVKKPKKVVFATVSYVLLDARIVSWKGWGEQTAVAKLRDLKLCDSNLGKCSYLQKRKPKQSTFKLKNPVKLTCEVGGKTKTVFFYKTMIARNPKQKGFRKPDRSVLTFGYPECPDRF